MSDVIHKGYRIRVVVEQILDVLAYESTQVIVHAERAFDINSAEFGAAIPDPAQAVVDLVHHEKRQHELSR